MNFEKYTQTERARVDKYKEELYDDEPYGFGTAARYEREKIERQPSFFRKMGRVALDAVGIKPYRLEQKREREAMAVALDEFRGEMEAKAAAEEAVRIEREKEEARLAEEREIAEAERERATLEKEMAGGHAWIDIQRENDWHNQRAQEMVEKDLNARLVTVDWLDDEVAAENPEVGKRSIEYDGAEIPVYDLKGLPFAMLNHTVTYRRVNKDDPNHIGSQTSQELVKHPEIWTMRRDEAEQDPDYGTRNGRAKGDVISCSYINSEANLESRAANTGSWNEDPDLCYGFAHLEGDSLLYATDGDGGTSNMGGRGRTRIGPWDVGFLEKIERAGGSMYNELVLRRYSDNGVARRPDYIIATNGKISEDILRHAKYFKIPIVNIEKRPYQDKMRERGLNILESVSEEDDYSEISEKMDALYEMSVFKSDATPLESLDDDDIAIRVNGLKTYSEKNPDLKMKNIDKLHALEIEKRISFLEDELKAAIKACRGKTEAKENYSVDSSPNCGSFHYLYGGADENGELWNVYFTRRGGHREVHSRIFKNPEQRSGHYLNELGYEPSKKHGAYERLVPLLHELEEAKKENSRVAYEARQAKKG